MNKKGSVFIITLSTSLILMIIGVGVSNLMVHDFYLIKRFRDKMQAKYIAEAGINDGLARLANNYDLSVFPISGTITGGTYQVSVITSGTRKMLSSVGTATMDTVTSSDDFSVTVSAEVTDSTPTSLNYIMSAGNDIKVRSGFLTLTDINGNVHGNNKVNLATGLLFGFMDVSGTATYSDDTVGIDTYIGTISVDGNTYGMGTHQTFDAWNNVPVTFPEFDYGYFKQLAIDGGDYYSADTEFDSVTISPSNGIVYVDGTATFKGTCNLNGSIIAQSIEIVSTKSGWFSPLVKGKLLQHASGILPYDFIVSNLGDITIGNKDGFFYRSADLGADAALIYSVNDIQALGAGTIIDITGAITAGGNIRLWDFFAYIRYTHEKPTVQFGPDVPLMRLVSWNK